MTRTNCLRLAVGLGALVVGLVVLLTHSREPVFQGRPLGSWFAQMYQPGSERLGPYRAFKAVGTAAVPFLLRELNAADSPCRACYRAALPKLPRWLNEKLPHPIPAIVRQNTAAAMLQYLGRDASVAIPSLVVALRSPDANTRANAARALGIAAAGPEADSVTLHLIAAMKDPEPRVRAEAAGSLGWMGARALPAKPLLIAALRDKEWLVVSNAASALGNLGTNALDAVPALCLVIQGHNASSRPRSNWELASGIALEALAKIDRQAAARMSTK